MSYKVFRDAVHNMISLHRESDGPASDPVDWGDALLLDLIDTPEMQRLRRIKQLGPAFQVYPSAEHSRFSHALGTMHLAKRILTTLLLRPDSPLDRETILQVKVAALLHDIGHGPYSHVFELVSPRFICHEILGWQVIAQSTNLRQIISQHCQRLNVPVEVFLQGVEAMLGMREATGTQRFGRQVISSQLDADRMDYLLRDAHFSGVSYGHYDLEWLLHSFRACRVAGEFRLCVEVGKGPSALESYVVARDHMYRQVYDHKTVRALEVLMVHLFQLLQWIMTTEGSLPAATPAALIRFIQTVHANQALSIEDYLALDDAVLDCAIGQWAAIEPHSFAATELRWKSRLLRDRKPVYRRLLWQLHHEDHPAHSAHPAAATYVSEQIHDSEIADAVDAFFQKIAHTPLTVDYLDEKIGAGRQVGPRGVRQGGQLPLYLLVRVDRLERSPYANVQYMAGKVDPILTMTGERGNRSQETLLPAEQASPLIKQLGESQRKLARVFVDPRVVTEVESLLHQQFLHPGVTIAARVPLSS